MTALLEFDSISKRVEARSAQTSFTARRLLGRVLLGVLLPAAFIVLQVALYRFLELLWPPSLAAFLISLELALLALIAWLALVRKT